MSKIVKDCIYGYVKISPLCQAFIDVPEFQRLRRIKQLGNVHRVYPSATHTRFEHSIGVMHLAGKVCKQLKISPEISNLIKLAGLYHDIGHLPYSHLFDKVLKIIQPPNVKLDHEDRSIDTFLLVSKRLQLLTEEDESFICACIKEQSLPKYDPYLFQIISGVVDVDKMDYLCRDAYHTGMPSYQAKYIILNMIVCDGKLCFNKKAKEDIKDLFETRRRMHELVYQHSRSLACDGFYISMILLVQDKLDYNHLCEYTLDTILMTDERTKEMYKLMEERKLDLTKAHYIVEKRIYDSGTIDQITFI
jgi:HD superfamily phosphohydrolase